MKSKIKLIALYLFTIVVILNNTIFTYAITEAEVENMVNESGKVAVTGNLFIWFICAFAFLKVSQKVDSYMSSLGLNVGHTGGSLLGDLVATGRGLAMANNMFSGQGFTDGSFRGGMNGQVTNSDTKFLQGGLAGAVGRKIDTTAKKLASDNGNDSLASPLFNSSMKNNGSFANNGIAAIAKGDIKKDGMITGEKANKAMSSYFSNSLNSNNNSSSSLKHTSSNNSVGGNQSILGGQVETNSSNILENSNQDMSQNNFDYNGVQTTASNFNQSQNLANNQAINSAENVTSNPKNSLYNQQSSSDKNTILSTNDNNISKFENATVAPNADGVLSNSNTQSFTQDTISNSNIVTPSETISTPSQSIDTLNTQSSVTPQTTETISVPTLQDSNVTYDNVEIGGGHITGIETSDIHPHGINFAMYNSEQYSKPNGDYTTVTSNDNTKWYKQYETKADKIGHTSKLVDRLPEPPKRKDTRGVPSSGTPRVVRPRL